MSDPVSAKSLLLSRQTELRAREARIGAHLRNLDQPLSPDSGDQAQEVEDDEVLQRLGVSERAELDQIGRALTRIELGTWGVCTVCGERIEPNRLAALPSADRCLGCSES